MSLRDTSIDLDALFCFWATYIIVTVRVTGVSRVLNVMTSQETRVTCTFMHDTVQADYDGSWA
jgi:hypothetical protein